MLAKLMEVFQEQNSGDSSFKFDFEAFRLKSAQTLRQAFRSMDDQSKREFLAWLGAVREIRSRRDLRYHEKEAALLELRSSETVFRTMKAIMDSAIGAAPAENQQILRTSLTGIGVATSLMRLPQIPIALALFSQALPKFLLTPHFEIVAAILEKELQEVLKEIQDPAKAK